MQKFLYRRKEDFVRKQTDNNDHKHNGNDLIHGAQFTSIMQKLAKSETGQDRHENFRRHERAPGKGPTLFHPANDKRKGRWQDNLEPHVQTFGAHGQSSTTVDWRHIAHASVGCDHYRPERAHYYHEKYRGFRLSEPQQRKWDPANARQRLQTEGERSNRVLQYLPTRGQQSQRQPHDKSNDVAYDQSTHCNDRCLDQSSIHGSAF